MAGHVRMDVREVLRHFKDLEGPRSPVNRLHPLDSVVVIAIMAVLAGANGPTAIAKWAKGNQGTLHDATIDYITEQTKADFRGIGARRLDPVEKKHGRIERRTYIQMPAPQSLPGFENWKGLLSIGIACLWCLRDGKVTTDVRYFIIPVKFIRGHRDRPFFLYFPHYNEHPSSVPSSVIRRGPWKLIETFDPEGLELYNLADDLGETNNLAAANSELVKDLRRELDAWRQDVGAGMMRPNPDYDPSVPLPTGKKGKKRNLE